jgi:hypothetical protein
MDPVEAARRQAVPDRACTESEVMQVPAPT